MRTRILVAIALAASPLLAQNDGGQADFAKDQAQLVSWLGAYEKGAIRMAKMGQVDSAAMARARDVMAAVSQHNTVEAARALFRIATVQPSSGGKSTSSTGYVDFISALRVGSIRSLARQSISRMDAKSIEDWLLATARKPRSKKDGILRTTTALQILAARPSERARQAVLEGAHSMKPEVRVQAVNTLSTVASRELLPHFFGLVRDKEPYVRIGAINGIGRALSEHTDETVHKIIPADVSKERDQAIKILRGAILKDRVWQVRASARENLARLKSKHSIPALIDGLAAEMKRKKDPWALDIKLHRTLEGMTGQKIPVGQVRIWREFWRKEGPTFAFAPADKKAAEVQKDSKYEKFF